MKISAYLKHPLNKPQLLGKTYIPLESLLDQQVWTDCVILANGYKLHEDWFELRGKETFVSGKVHMKLKLTASQVWHHNLITNQSPERCKRIFREKNGTHKR